jgi:8-oxo-dGTP pyrophosphatase MutT (NUDIX family)
MRYDRAVTTSPTHAGGVVIRIIDGAPHALVITARRNPDHWVLPKGHIEAGESAADAAVREVREEAGVIAELLEPVEDVRLRVGGEDQVIRYFLMRAPGDASAGEGRQALWLRARDAEERVSFAEARGTLRRGFAAWHSRGDR